MSSSRVYLLLGDLHAVQSWLSKQGRGNYWIESKCSQTLKCQQALKCSQASQTSETKNSNADDWQHVVLLFKSRLVTDLANVKKRFWSAETLRRKAVEIKFRLPELDWNSIRTENMWIGEKTMSEHLKSVTIEEMGRVIQHAKLPDDSSVHILFGHEYSVFELDDWSHALPVEFEWINIHFIGSELDAHNVIYTNVSAIACSLTYDKLIELYPGYKGYKTSIAL